MGRTVGPQGSFGAVCLGLRSRGFRRRQKSYGGRALTQAAMGRAVGVGAGAGERLKYKGQPKTFEIFQRITRMARMRKRQGIPTIMGFGLKYGAAVALFG